MLEVRSGRIGRSKRPKKFLLEFTYPVTEVDIRVPFIAAAAFSSD
jgi:hypothetical protein